jgi:hypothetical protein
MHARQKKAQNDTSLATTKTSVHIEEVKKIKSNTSSDIYKHVLKDRKRPLFRF